MNFESGDREGSVFSPMPAGLFEAAADELFTTRFQAARAERLWQILERSSSRLIRGDNMHGFRLI